MILPEAAQAKSGTQGSIAELGVASMSIDAPIPQAGPRRASVTLSRITPSYSGQALSLRRNPGSIEPILIEARGRLLEGSGARWSSSNSRARASSRIESVQCIQSELADAIRDRSQGADAGEDSPGGGQSLPPPGVSRGGG